MNIMPMLRFSSRSALILALLLARPVSADEPPDFVNRFFQLVNSVRTATHLNALNPDPSLRQSAALYAVFMADRNWLSHVGPNGDTAADRDRQFGYNPVLWGEDLAAGCPSPENAFATFMNSPPHRALILFPGFTDIGIGVENRPGTPYGIYWAVEFGARGVTSPPPTSVACYLVPP
jgi:uncharacterized protein YkwD